MTAFPNSVPGLPSPAPRTVIYIDGFNLYYGALKGTKFKWLDLVSLFAKIRPHDNIVIIRYFTAMVTGANRVKQETYLSALATTPIVEVVLGRYKNKTVTCAYSPCTHPGKRLFEVPEEKRTDVNIAIYMLDDAYQDIFDQAVVVSGDSDLVPAVRMVRTRFPQKKIFVYVPSNNPVRSYAVELRSAANKSRDLPVNLLQFSQFESQIQDGSGGMIYKPASW